MRGKCNHNTNKSNCPKATISKHKKKSKKLKPYNQDKKELNAPIDKYFENYQEQEKEKDRKKKSIFPAPIDF